jgi:streptomycin 6-kinase
MTTSSALERLDAHVRQWGITVDDVRTTETSLLAVGTRRGQRVVLKVARTEGEEWRCGELVAAFEGHGLVRALEYQDGVALLERLDPGDDLSGLSMRGRDDEATAIIADIIGRMASVRPDVRELKSARDFIPDFQTYRHICDGMMPVGMLETAERVYRELCGTQVDERILHGDLHHYNVLFDSQRGWLAIDPWGVRAEIEYEVGASLRNPIDAPHLLARPEIVRRRLDIFRRRLGFDADRALGWGFAQAVLAALWPTEEGVGIDMRAPFIAAATAMMTLIEGNDR